MTAKSITVQIRTVYGRDVVYPACPTSLIFAGMCRTKTLSDENLRDIQRLGYEIKVEAPQVTIREAV